MNGNSKSEYLINRKNIDKIKNKEQYINKNYSETIIIIIVNKIISNTIHEIRRKETLEKMKVYCFDFLKNNINIFLKSQFFVYDNELDLNKEKIFFDFKQEKFDKGLSIISEPETPEKDRNNSNMINIIQNKRLSVDNKVFEPIESQKNSLNELIELENLLEINKVKDKIIDEPNKEIEDKPNINNNLNEDNSTNTLNENLIISLPCTDLEEDKYTNIYRNQNNSRELNILRKDMEIEMKKKKKERQLEKRKSKKERKSLNILGTKKIKKIKFFNSNDLSFDSNGNIIKKKLIPIDSFAKDFNFVKFLVHKINKKNRKSRLNLLNVNNIKDTEKSNIENEKSKKISNEIIKIKIENKGTFTERNSILQKIEFNPKDEEENYQNTKYKKINEENKNIVLCNSCNNNIIPEPGVILKTDIINKTGGKNFFMKYNRPSMKEFNNFILNLSNSMHNSISAHEMIKSTESTNNGLNSNEIIEEANESNLKYNGYKQKFEENNPLIKGAKTIDQKFNMKFKCLNNQIKQKKINQNSTRILSNYKIKNLNWRINNFSDSMVLSKNMRSLSNGNFDNLYNYLSERNVYNNFDFSNESSDIKVNYKVKSSNSILKNIITERIKYKKLIFPKIKDKNKEKIDNNKNLIDSMEKFNQKIIKDINFDIWGYNSESITNPRNISYNNNNIKPFSLFRNLNINKFDNKRERKNIVNMFQKNNKLRYENSYNFGSKNKKILSE